MLQRLLNPEQAYIFRITHIRNLSWILDNGLHCRNSSTRDPNFIEIGNPDIIERRRHQPVQVPPGGVLGDYIPFYFATLTPMLYNITTGWQNMKRTPASDIAILIASLRRLHERGIRFVTTDRNAALTTARYANGLTGL